MQKRKFDDVTLRCSISISPSGSISPQTMQTTSPEIAQILLERGADPNVRDPDVNRTPLHDAVQYGTPNTVLVLLQGGADATIKESLFGDTPAHVAAKEGKHLV